MCVRIIVKFECGGCTKSCRVPFNKVLGHSPEDNEENQSRQILIRI
jgi:hypothetical protein